MLAHEVGSCKFFYKSMGSSFGLSFGGATTFLGLYSDALRESMATGGHPHHH